MMERLELEIRDASGSKCRKLLLPVQFKMEELIPQIISKLKLPQSYPSGDPIHYCLVQASTGKLVPMDRSLAELKLKPEDQIVILPWSPRDPRKIRLKNDHLRMLDLSRIHPIKFQAEGDPPHEYLVEFSCPGLVEIGYRISISNQHRVKIHLHKDYPNIAPRMDWLTPIFHPNILGPDHPSNPGAVQIRSWAPSIFLDKLCSMLMEMVRLERYDLSNALNPRAAEWVVRNKDALPMEKFISSRRHPFPLQ